jgi:hypothetical protein
MFAGEPSRDPTSANLPSTTWNHAGRCCIYAGSRTACGLRLKISGQGLNAQLYGFARRGVLGN